MENFETDEIISKVLTETKSIAVVGASPNPARPSHRVTRFLVERGYKVWAVNPGHAGKVISGAMTYASLSDVPGKIDMVDVFRASRFVDEVVDAALALPDRPKVIWTQLDVRDDRAAKRARDVGLTVIQNRCPAIEIPRLGL